VPKINPSEVPPDELPHVVKQLTEQMDLAARNLEFEKAAALRDEINRLSVGLPKATRAGGLTGRGRGKTKGRSSFARRRF
jgi:hypothetical protein